MLKQPAYKNIPKRVIGELKNSNKAMNDSFWLGVWPGLESKHFEYILEKIKLYINQT